MACVSITTRHNVYFQGWSYEDMDLPADLRLFSDVDSLVSHQGMEVVGVPVGSTAFCSNIVQKTLKAMLVNSELLVELHPQCATKLLKDCVCAAPAYVAQVCHPSITMEHLRNFDNSIWNLWLRILGSSDESDDLAHCSVALQRARLRATLPLPP